MKTLGNKDNQEESSQYKPIKILANNLLCISTPVLHAGARLHVFLTPSLNTENHPVCREKGTKPSNLYLVSLQFTHIPYQCI